MSTLRRIIGYVLVCVTQLALIACTGISSHADRSVVVLSSADVQTQQALAPHGVLRVGVYLGSPTSLVIDAKTGVSSGVAFELGHALGEALELPVKVIQYQRVAEVIDALKHDQVDMTFTNATPVRANEIDFTPVLIQLELGVLVPRNSSIRSFEDLNRPEVRLGVSQGSSSQRVLSQRLSKTVIVPVSSLTQASQMLSNGELNAFATNKGILFELAEKMGTSQVLNDKWGVENLAIAIPKGREIAMPYLVTFAKHIQKTGRINEMAARAGLRGMQPVNSSASESK